MVVQQIYSSVGIVEERGNFPCFKKCDTFHVKSPILDPAIGMENGEQLQMARA